VTQSSYPFIAIDPVAFSVGPLDVHWYGIMYLLAFLFFWAGGAWLAKRRQWWGWNAQDVGDFLFYGMLGVVLGGRLGYVLFYGFQNFLDDPVFLFRIIGGELWGRFSDLPWAMIFANAIQPGGWRSEELEAAWRAGALDHLARHPSQLYQVLGEGLGLFVLLIAYSRRPRPTAAVSGLFLLGYGCFRFMAEFFREPDEHIGFVSGEWLTMGMVLSLPMVLAGAVIMFLAHKGWRKH